LIDVAAGVALEVGEGMDIFEVNHRAK
jgi:hypothetical protein